MMPKVVPNVFESFHLFLSPAGRVQGGQRTRRIAGASPKGILLNSPGAGKIWGEKPTAGVPLTISRREGGFA